MTMMQRCAHFLSRNLIEHHRGIIILPSTAVTYNRVSDDPTTISSLRQSSFRSSQHQTTTIRTLTTTEDNDNDPPPPIIQGTLPPHGKGIQIGQYAQIHRKFTQEDVNLFGALSGDLNPVHFPPLPTTTSLPSTIKQSLNDPQSSLSSSPPIVHGILLSSLYSTIFGTLIPGAIYRYQSLKFHNVVCVNEEVVGRVVVTKLRQVGGSGVLCTCDTSVVKMGNNDNNEEFNRSKEEIVCISGDAQVWLPGLQLEDECREKEE